MDTKTRCAGCGKKFDTTETGWIETGDGDICPDCAAEMRAEEEWEIQYQEQEAGLA